MASALFRLLFESNYLSINHARSLSLSPGWGIRPSYVWVWSPHRDEESPCRANDHTASTKLCVSMGEKMLLPDKVYAAP